MNGISIVTKIITIINIYNCNQHFQIVDRKLYTEISLKEHLNISSYFQVFLENKKYTDDRRIEVSDLSDKENTINIEKNEKKTIYLPKAEGSYLESLEYYLDSVIKDNKPLILKEDYGYYLSYPDDLITTYQKPIAYFTKENINDYNLEFNIFQPDLNIEFNGSLLNLELEDVKSIRNVIIGICKIENTLKAFVFTKEKLQPYEITKLFEIDPKLQFNEKKFSRIFLESKASKENQHILIIDQDKNVYIFKVIEIMSQISNELPKISINLVTSFFEKRLNQKNNIVDFVEQKDNFIIGFEVGIVIRDFNNEIKSLDIVIENAQVKTDELKVIDMEIINNAIYVIIKSYGLRILDVSNPEKTTWTDFEFYHPFLSKINSHHNPYHSHPFISILINNRAFTEGTEFFLELSAKDEYKPLLYRYYLSDKYLDIKNIVSDEKFTYLFEHNSNSIYVLSRSITASGRNSVYKIQIKDISNIEVTSAPFIFNDENYIHEHLGLIANKNFVFTEKVQINAAKVEILFKKTGNYQLKYYTFTDFCGLPKNEVKMCKFYVTQNFEVSVGKSDTFINIIKIIFLLVIIIVILGIVLLLFKFEKIKTWWQRRNYIQHYQVEEEQPYGIANTHPNTKNENKNNMSDVKERELKSISLSKISHE